MTGTGLVTVDLSALTPWQQVIIVFVSLVGSPVRLSFKSSSFGLDYSPRTKVFVSLVSVYVRKQYFTRNLGLVVRSEFERTNTQDLTRRRTQSIQWSARQDANDSSIHNTAPSHLVIRRVDTEPRPIPSTDFGVILPSHAPPHESPFIKPGEGSNQYGIHRESPLTSAVSTHQTSLEPRLRPSQ